MTKKHVHYLDYLRAFAIIGVLVIHTSTPYVGMFNKIEFWKWETSIIYSSLIRWCVPIFFMVSGALLLGRKEEPLKEFFLKRGNRILIPFVIWTGLYFIWRSYFWNTEISVREFVTLILNNGTYYHLWYFYALIGVYLLIPVFNIFVNHASRNLIRYIVILWIIFYCGFRYYSFIEKNNYAVFFPLTEFIGMLLLGYYLSKYEQNQKTRVLIYLFGLIGFIGTVWRTTNFAIDQGAFSGYAFSYSSPGVMAMAIAIFVFTKQYISTKSETNMFETNRMIKIISTTSFGIYLIHPIFLDLLRPYFHEGINLKLHPLLGVPLQTIIILTVSAVTTWILLKIPFLRRIVS